jgi:hypothetical protein
LSKFCAGFLAGSEAKAEWLKERTQVRDCRREDFNEAAGQKDKQWGHSSAGRAPALQAGGRRFDPDWLHHLTEKLELMDEHKYSMLIHEF